MSYQYGQDLVKVYANEAFYALLQGVLVDINPLPTNDAHMCHGLSITHKNLYGGFNTRRYTSVHGFCFF